MVTVGRRWRKTGIVIVISLIRLQILDLLVAVIHLATDRAAHQCAGHAADHGAIVTIDLMADDRTRCRTHQCAILGVVIRLSLIHI